MLIYNKIEEEHKKLEVEYEVLTKKSEKEFKELDSSGDFYNRLQNTIFFSIEVTKVSGMIHGNYTHLEIHIDLTSKIHFVLQLMISLKYYGNILEK